MWYNELRPQKHLVPNKFSLLFIDPKTGKQRMSESDKKRAVKGLINLKKGILEHIPRKKVDDNILLATWNIKEFGHLTKRLPEAYFYIAEIINAFDVVAIQEIKTSLKDLEIVMRILGSDWSYVITDITDGKSGNKERFGYIYDTRRVEHSGLSGEVVIPPEVYQGAAIDQLKRTPSIIGFKSGWKKFSILNVHLHPGKKKAKNGKISDHDFRKAEVKLLLKVLGKKKKEGRLWNENLIILGDTNLYKKDVDIVKLITDNDFKESEGLLGKMTNTSLNEIYDRIFLGVDNRFKLMKDDHGKEKGGVFKVFDYVLSDEMIPEYHDVMKAQKGNPDSLQTDVEFRSYFNRFWKRNQISDHLPVWIEIDTDSSPDFLRYIASQL